LPRLRAPGTVEFFGILPVLLMGLPEQGRADSQRVLGRPSIEEIRRSLLLLARRDLGVQKLWKDSELGYSALDNFRSSHVDDSPTIANPYCSVRQFGG
jgi:hypothetical protein